MVATGQLGPGSFPPCSPLHPILSPCPSLITRLPLPPPTIVQCGSRGRGAYGGGAGPPAGTCQSGVGSFAVARPLNGLVASLPSARMCPDTDAPTAAILHRRSMTSC